MPADPVAAAAIEVIVISIAVYAKCVAGVDPGESCGSLARIFENMAVLLANLLGPPGRNALDIRLQIRDKFPMTGRLELVKELSTEKSYPCPTGPKAKP
jgi:hypothetical protein